MQNLPVQETDWRERDKAMNRTEIKLVVALLAAVTFTLAGAMYGQRAIPLAFDFLQSFS